MTDFLRTLAAGLFLALSPTMTASAASLTDCRSLTDDAERLACYDRLAENQTNSPAAPASTPTRNMEQAGHESTSTPNSLLGKAWELDPAYRGRILRIRQYQPVYLLPLFSASNPNRQPSSPSPDHSTNGPIDLKANEAKLQLSLKTKLYEDVFGNNGDLWFGYTQSSRWQVYNGGLSRPFRETNYEPELMFVWRTDYNLSGWHGRLFNLSLNHQSNGRALPLSRSWNRVMLSTSLERENWTMTLRPWWRIPESANKDDNPDIADYMGRADVQLVRTAGKHQFSLLLRHSLRGGERNRGAVQMDYAFPIAGDLRGHLQWFSGYGESLIDYNHRGNYLGIGVSLLEWY